MILQRRVAKETGEMYSFYFTYSRRKPYSTLDGSSRASKPSHSFLSAGGARVLCSSPPAPGTLVLPPPLAHGAAIPAPGGGSLALAATGDGDALVLDAQGALVGWFGPAGTFGPAAFAQGAAVIGIAPPPTPAMGSLKGG